MARAKGRRYRRPGTGAAHWRALAWAAILVASMLSPAQGGYCTFSEECFHAGVDTGCTPQPVEEGAQSFPLDAAHGFGVLHEKVWDGSMEDPTTGVCEQGTPDEKGRCMVNFVPPKGLEPVAPVMCPQYQDDGCCSWQQNYALYQNLRTLVDSFGSSTGCLACAVNLVNFWCALICSPDQGSFVSLHEPPFAQRTDDLAGGSARVLQADVTVDGDLACRIYDSCKSVAIVGETTAMQSGLGLLKFQMQTGAIGHGEFFFLSFANISHPGRVGQESAGPREKGSMEDDLETSVVQVSSSDKGKEVRPFLALDTLACDSFYDPGSNTVPFRYPPPKEQLLSCSCDYCAASCTGQSGIDVDLTRDRPIPVLDGFAFGLVGSVLAAVAACSVALHWWRSQGGRDSIAECSSASRRRWS